MGVSTTARYRMAGCVRIVEPHATAVVLTPMLLKGLIFISKTADYNVII